MCCARAWLGSMLLAATAYSLVAPGSASAQDLILPEWEYEPSEDASKTRRGAGKAAEISYSFVNDTVSDAWSITKSPLGWGPKDWLWVAALAGATTGIVYTVDSQVREAALGSHGFEKFGDGIRPLGTGPGLVALTGGFLLAGAVLDRPKEIETARLLLEASAIGLGFTVLGKYTIGRYRPRANRGPLAFEPFGGSVSMPSGETTSAFIMAGVIASQYPQWYWQLTAYSLATAVGAGRVALDAHWTSDVFVSAVLGIAVSKAVVHLNRIRIERRRLRQGRGGKPDIQHHYFAVTPRSFRWTYIW
ncbi:MAG: phosphatase PAP2 family protein [Deltaproteobacteria bacterium]|nr:phosphatase PAP2 family protein [Deltaproteobacteria bacterium]